MKKSIYVILFLFFVVFWYRGSMILDPDFGWHLKMGQLIVHTGIPHADPFSYTMPSFPAVDHEWLSDVFIASVYPFLGLSGLAFLCALITTVTLWIGYQTIPEKGRILSLPVVLLSGITLVLFTGVRPQILTWFFFACVLYILEKQVRLWVLPLLFLLWANLHGGFGVGIAAVGIWTMVQCIREKRIVWTWIALSISCVLMTLCNPYGYHLWGEVWSSLSDTQLRQYIIEWQPSIFSFDLFSVWVAFGLLLAFVVSFGIKKRPEWLVLFLLLSFMALSSMRNVSLWFIVAVPYGGILLAQFVSTLTRDQSARLFLLYRYVLGGVIVCVLVEFVFACLAIHDMQISRMYPVREVAYLQQHLFHDHIFTTYNWGGYLIWQLPSEKEFIDGRMPSWRQKKQGETSYAFGDYRNVLIGKTPLKTVIDQYHISTFLLPKDVPQTKETSVPHVLSFLIPEPQKKAKLSDQLRALGFHSVFTGDVGTVYQK